MSEPELESARGLAHYKTLARIGAHGRELAKRLGLR